MCVFFFCSGHIFLAVCGLFLMFSVFFSSGFLLIVLVVFCGCAWTHADIFVFGLNLIIVWGSVGP